MMLLKYFTQPSYGTTWFGIIYSKPPAQMQWFCLILSRRNRMERTINDVKTDLLGLDYITLELPKPLALRAKEVAKQTGQHLEEMLVEWIDRLATDPPIEYRPDDQILALCDLQMNVAQQDELSDLLARNKEGLLAKKKKMSD
jgi:hypothetical protein